MHDIAAVSAGAISTADEFEWPGRQVFLNVRIVKFAIEELFGVV